MSVKSYLVRGLLGLLVVVAPVFIAHGAVARQASFDHATAAYGAGNYKQALDDYRAISDKNYQIYFNMGNCAYKMGERGYALLYWRQAERLSGFSHKKELLQNVALLKAELALATGKGESLKKLNSLRWWSEAYVHSYILSMPLLFIQLLFLVLWLFLFFYLRYLYNRRHRILIVILFTLIAFFGTLLALRYGMERKASGVVIISSAKVYAGPANSYEQIGMLSQAQELTITKEHNDFYRIKNGLVNGWVQKNMVGRINE